MNNYEFIKYTPTPAENYMGVVEIFICGKFTQLFKIVMRKDGSGFFPASVSIKMKENGSDVYHSSFKIDSEKEKAALHSFIISNVKAVLDGSSVQVNNSPVPSYYPSKEAQQNSNKGASFDEMPF